MFLDNLLARAKIVGRNERMFRENMTEARKVGKSRAVFLRGTLVSRPIRSLCGA